MANGSYKIKLILSKKVSDTFLIKSMFHVLKNSVAVDGLLLFIRISSESIALTDATSFASHNLDQKEKLLAEDTIGTPTIMRTMARSPRLSASSIHRSKGSHTSGGCVKMTSAPQST